MREVSALGLEVCTTLGMLTEDQAAALKKAGVHAYNHNLDTSPEYYTDVITRALRGMRFKRWSA